VRYQEWDDGGGLNLEVRNDGAADVDDWTLTFELDEPQRLAESWSARWRQDGGRVTVRPEDWNATIRPGGTASFGTNLRRDGKKGRKAKRPGEFALDGVRCDVLAG
jgi:cellulase/cellobiase CelA1